MEMLNPLGMGKQQGGLPKWINIVGVGKQGKTKTLVELASQVPIVYFDTDPLKGTKGYEGYFLQAESYLQFRQKLDEVKNKINKGAKVTAIVIDTFDGLLELISDHISATHNNHNFSEIEANFNGKKGNGWTLYQGMSIDIVSEILTLVPLLITITHLKQNLVGQPDVVQRKIASIDVRGQMRSYIYNNCDANMWTSINWNQETNKNELQFLTETSDPYFEVEGIGSRYFPGLFDCKNAEGFINYIVNNYKTQN